MAKRTNPDTELSFRVDDSSYPPLVTDNQEYNNTTSYEITNDILNNNSRATYLSPSLPDAPNIVYIHSVPRESIQGRHLYQGEGGKLQPKAKAKNAAHTFKIALNRNTGLLNTGFDRLVTNLWYAASEEESGLPTDWFGTKIWTKKEIPLQIYLEIKHNKKPGEYTSKLPPLFSFSEPTDLQRFSYVLYEGANILDLSKPKQELMYYLSLASKVIANSQDEITIDSLFYVSQINESEERRANKNEIIEEAQHNLYVLKSKGSQENVYKVAVVLGLVRGDVSMEGCKNKLSEYINEKDNTQFSRIASFNKSYEMTLTQEGLKQLDAEFFLCQAVHYRVMSDYQGTYEWHNAPSQDLKKVGYSKESAIRFILDPNKVEFVKMISGELKSKKALYIY